ncbi:MAG: phospholipase [Candidatus Marinimicrobia bacterium]|nr:phospholipase [Candidatus Neomarinimicrobiota bacterium]
MSIQEGNIELHMGPSQLGAPDNLQDVIVGFIDGAKKRLDVAVQELESEPIAQALIRARQRRVVVRVVIEWDYLSVSRAISTPFDSGGANEANREIHDAMLRANIRIHTDFNPHIFHQKFIIRDSSSPDAAVLTGSTNFTPTGTAQNLNHLVIIHNRALARLYWREFKEIMQGHFGKLNEGHDPVPPNVTVSGVRVKVLFAPDHNPEMEIMKQMAKARRRIDFAIFTFAQSSGIDDIMISLARAGTVKIRGALDGMVAGQKWAATEGIAAAGAELYSVPHRKGLNKLHHKLMVIDGQVIIAGSFNYTGPATRLNDENILIIGDLGAGDPAVRERQKRLGKFALNEIDRIIGVHGVRY